MFLLTITPFLNYKTLHWSTFLYDADWVMSHVNYVDMLELGLPNMGQMIANWIKIYDVREWREWRERKKKSWWQPSLITCYFNLMFMMCVYLSFVMLFGVRLLLLCIQVILVYVAQSTWCYHSLNKTPGQPEVESLLCVCGSELPSLW